MPDANPDLFDTPPSAPAPTRPSRAQGAPTLRPAAPTLAWARLLAQSSVGHQTIIFVSWLWAGEIRECLSDPVFGRKLLHKDGRISEIAPDRGASGRFVYLNPTLAQEMHARTPLVRTGTAGTHSARYRYEEPGEAAPTDLDLPPGCEYG